MTNISIYSKANDTKSKKTIPIDLFFEGIRDGKWQDIVLPIRTISDKEQRTEAKKIAPAVTIGGLFKERTDSGLDKHSGFLAVDIDDVEDINHLKSLICTDKYVYAAFVSIGGRGLCVVLKINGVKHREAFQGASEYFYDNYRVILDPTSINVSRLRFVSYDPDIYLSDTCERFAQYPKTKPPKKVDKTVFAKDDFTSILDQIVQRRLNLCENYHEWLRIGFSLTHHFGEGGREYYHVVSQYSSKYDSTLCDKQYTACLKHRGSNQSTIATFYYYCKLAGVSVYSERTRKIAYSAHHGKKGGLGQEQVVANLAKFEDITGPDVADLVAQVINNDIEVKGEDSFIVELKQWLSHNYTLARNEITRKIECDGVPMDDVLFNSIFISAKNMFEKVTFDLIDKAINSDFVSTYNPIHDFFSANVGVVNTGTIDTYISCFTTDDNTYFLHFFKKWIVGIVASAYGQHCPLMLVYVGKQGNGKTRAFRDLLPADLKHYFAESKLDLGKDDEILMTQKLVIMDDEMGGKSKKESTRLKELTSKQMFSLRAPYGRYNVDLKRLAVLCGTTNDERILNDPTGNRRIIPICINTIDYKAINKVDRVALIMEAHALYKSGFEYELSSHDVAYLNGSDGRYQDYSQEYELINKFFEQPNQYNGVEMTATEVKIFIELKTLQKLNLNKIGSEMQRLGYRQEIKRIDGKTKRIYAVHEKSNVTAQNTDVSQDLPF